jgi:hypothetical protein
MDSWKMYCFLGILHEGGLEVAEFNTTFQGEELLVVPSDYLEKSPATFCR